MSGSEGSGARSAGIALIAIGAIGIVVALIGTTAKWGSTTKTAGVNTAPIAATPTTRTTSATVTTAGSQPVLPETIDGFLAALGKAYQQGDRGFLLSHVDREVTRRYGAAQCLDHFRTATDPTARYVRTGAPTSALYVWTTDGASARFPDAIAVPVTATTGGKTGSAVVHLTNVGGTYRFFVDCGNPIAN